MENLYLKTGDKRACNGCGACTLVCPVDAIHMEEDSEGFLYPQINNKCINCGRCKNTCSNFPVKNDFKIKAYAAKNKNDNERAGSTSGGMFVPLCRYVIAQNGVVFGAVYGEKHEIYHSYVTSFDDCKKFSGSKYVRSDLEDTYLKAKDFLEQGKLVLFSGTPCQCFGLQTFLGKEYGNLILCEIICHANPSPKIFKIYIRNREKNKQIKEFHFRSKNGKPYIEYKDGTTRKDTLYNRAFLTELINRPSCNSCSFAGVNRKNDFTIGDFWGVDSIVKGFDDGKGISLLTVNTAKGERIYEEIKDDMILKEVDFKSAFTLNHHKNVPPHPKRAEFFKEEINENNIVKKLTKYTQNDFFHKLLRRIISYKFPNRGNN